jgi:hypothetical protein
MAMSDSVTFDPKDFSEEELVLAARGERAELKPQLAVVLLRAKLGDAAEQLLTEFATDESLDTRARHAAVSQLGAFPAARGVLDRLADSSDEIVAAAAAKALAEE